LHTSYASFGLDAALLVFTPFFFPFLSTPPVSWTLHSPPIYAFSYTLSHCPPVFMRTHINWSHSLLLFFTPPIVFCLSCICDSLPSILSCARVFPSPLSLYLRAFFPRIFRFPPFPPKEIISRIVCLLVSTIFSTLLVPPTNPFLISNDFFRSLKRFCFPVSYFRCRELPPGQSRVSRCHSFSNLRVRCISLALLVVTSLSQPFFCL